MALSAPYAAAVSGWTLNEVSGNRADSIGSKTLTDVNSVGSTTGVLGNAATFASASSRYMYASFTPPSGTMSISLWMRSSTASRGIFTWENDNGATSGTYDRALYLNPAGYLIWYVYNGSGNSINTNAPINDGNWHHIGVTINSGMKMFLDGVEQGDNEVGISNGYNGYGTPFLVVGAVNSGLGLGSRFFDGDLDDFVVMNNYALSAAECAEIYNSGTGKAFSTWAGAAVRPRAMLTLGCGC